MKHIIKQLYVLLVLFASIMLFTIGASAADTCQFTKMDGSAYTLPNNGHRKVVFIYNVGCFNCQAVGPQLGKAALDYSNLDLIYAAVPTKSELLPTVNYYAKYNNSIIFCKEANKELNELARRSDTMDANAFPFIYYLDEQNRIMTATSGLREDVYSDLSSFMSLNYKDQHLEHTFENLKGPDASTGEILRKCVACGFSDKIYAPIGLMVEMRKDNYEYDSALVEKGHVLEYKQYCLAYNGVYYGGISSDVLYDISVSASSSDKTIATVDEKKQTITFLKDGNVSITFTSNMNPKIQKEYKFCVGNCTYIPENDFYQNPMGPSFNPLDWFDWDKPDSSDEQETEKPSVDTKPVSVSASIKLNKSTFEYTGKAIKPSITVKDEKGAVISKDCYSVKYANNKKVGTATVTVTLKCQYNGTAKTTFKIVPKGTKLTKLEPKKKAVTVKWKKQNKQTTGYQIQYSTDSKFKKNTKTVTIKKNNITKTTLKKLKSKKTYYVRIRTFKTVNGYCSAWSKIQKVKVK